MSGFSIKSYSNSLTCTPQAENSRSNSLHRPRWSRGLGWPLDLLLHKNISQKAQAGTEIQASWGSEGAGPWLMGRGGRSVVRALGSWSKGLGFVSPQEQQENFLLQGQPSVLTLFCYLFPLLLPQQHVKDPSHSAKSVGGRLQLNMHAPCVCHSAWSDMVHGCMVYTECIETAAVSCGTSHASAVSKPLWWIIKNVL